MTQCEVAASRLQLAVWLDMSLFNVESLAIEGRNELTESDCMHSYF